MARPHLRRPRQPGDPGRHARALLLALAPAAALAAAPAEHPGKGAHHRRGSSVVGPAQVVSWGPDGTLEDQVPPRWRHLRGPIGTVCVTGGDREGKSTLLNLWAQNFSRPDEPPLAEFPIGHGRASHTRGLWSAILPPEATGLGYHLNLCDSQGLKQVSEVSKWRLFSANVLLPAVLVYMLIDVVQNDQIRDLAQMAHQFQQLSGEGFQRFGSLLSPHLVVVVREESDLGNRSALSAHLEDVLTSDGYAEDKQLIRRVFHTREAWPLYELPREGRRALRTGLSLMGAEGDEWRESGQEILQHVLSALERKRGSFPRGGPELVEWYRSVLDTVNSHEDGSMERLIDHGARIAAGHWRQRLLEDWGSLVLAFLAGASLLLAFGGCLGRLLDWTAWCAWLVFCVCYIGTCPLVTAPLKGFIAGRCCDSLVGANAWLPAHVGAVLHGACRQVSAHTAALVVAVALGAMSYPVITAQLRRLVSCLPAPLRPPPALLTAVVAAVGLGLGEAGLSSSQDPAAGGWEAWGSLVAGAVLAGVALHSGLELVWAVRHNRCCELASWRGREAHWWVAERIEEVRELQATSAWRQHYRRHSPTDAIWRFRRVRVWPHAVVCGQACTFLSWQWLIHPHCELLLVIGAAANLLQLLCRAAAARCRRRRGPMATWLAGLEDEASAASDEGEGQEEVVCVESCEAGGTQARLSTGTDTGGLKGVVFGTPSPKNSRCESPRSASPAAALRRRSGSGRPQPPPPILPETEEELMQRKSIEEMRILQEGLVARLYFQRAARTEGPW